MKKKRINLREILTLSIGAVMFIIGLCALICVSNDIIPHNLKLPAEVWGTVSDWMMILVTIFTAVLLLLTLESQQKQISIQKEEIDRNRRDVEFNRTLDLVYRQLEYSNKTAQAINLDEIERINEALSSLPFANRKHEYFVENVEKIYLIVKASNKLLNAYRRIINENKLGEDDVMILIYLLRDNLCSLLYGEIVTLKQHYDQSINKEKLKSDKKIDELTYQKLGNIEYYLKEFYGYFPT